MRKGEDEEEGKQEDQITQVHTSNGTADLEECDYYADWW